MGDQIDVYRISILHIGQGIERDLSLGQAPRNLIEKETVHFQLHKGRCQCQFFDFKFPFVIFERGGKRFPRLRQIRLQLVHRKGRTTHKRTFFYLARKIRFLQSRFVSRRRIASSLFFILLITSETSQHNPQQQPYIFHKHEILRFIKIKTVQVYETARDEAPFREGFRVSKKTCASRSGDVRIAFGRRAHRVRETCAGFFGLSKSRPMPCGWSADGRRFWRGTYKTRPLQYTAQARCRPVL